jgi:hypothetical protein
MRWSWERLVLQLTALVTFIAIVSTDGYKPADRPAESRLS